MASLRETVINANIAVHSRLAAHYEECEPHFRPENVAKVGRRLAALVEQTRAVNLLDLGCGTGFVINLAKPHVTRIVGVDVTRAMLERVDRTGPAEIELVEQDTGTYSPMPGVFQLVTAYSFLHHLADLAPTFLTASRALASGGRFYADLDPNHYFWKRISGLDRHGSYHSLVLREIESVKFKDEEIEGKFGVSRDVFKHAEFGKDIQGGFREEDLRTRLLEAGFRAVEFHYEWFLGEGFLINSGAAPRDQLIEQASLIHDALQRAMPVSRDLFKYLGFVAIK